MTPTGVGYSMNSLGSATPKKSSGIGINTPKNALWRPLQTAKDQLDRSMLKPEKRETIRTEDDGISRTERNKTGSTLRSFRAGDMLSPSSAHYKFSSKDSRFEEIRQLQSKNFLLKKENSILQNSLEEIDEFDLVLNRKTKIENFNEKRCDILKACVHKQKRYIDYLNKSFKLSNKFYKDIKHVLQFLSELDKKYMKSSLKMKGGDTRSS